MCRWSGNSIKDECLEEGIIDKLEEKQWEKDFYILTNDERRDSLESGK